MQDPHNQNWQMYPLSFPKSASAIYDDVQSTRELLQELSSSLFVADDGKIGLELITYNQAPDSPQGRRGSSLSAAVKLIRQGAKPTRERVESATKLSSFLKVTFLTMTVNCRMLIDIRPMNRGFQIRCCELIAVKQYVHFLNECLSSTLPQLNSWSRLRVTQEVFCCLCHGLQVFPGFIRLIAHFGQRVSDVGDDSLFCQRRMHLLKEQSRAGYGEAELCC